MSGRFTMRSLMIVVVLVMFTLTLGCGAAKQAKNTTPAWTPTKVVVLPYQKVDASMAENGMVRSPLTGSVFSAANSQGGAEGLSSLDRALGNNLQSWAKFKWVPETMSDKTFHNILRQDPGKPLMEVILQTGKAFEADAVLIGHLYRFARRVGSEISAERPASVAFDLALVRVSDAQVIWKNSFDETQKSLTENIFNIGQYFTHGLRWYTAEELATYGMDTLLERFPWRPRPSTDDADRGE